MYDHKINSFFFVFADLSGCRTRKLESISMGQHGINTKNMIEMIHHNPSTVNQILPLNHDHLPTQCTCYPPYEKIIHQFG